MRRSLPWLWGLSLPHGRVVTGVSSLYVHLYVHLVKNFLMPHQSHHIPTCSRLCFFFFFFCLTLAIMACHFLHVPVERPEMDCGAV